MTAIRAGVMAVGMVLAAFVLAAPAWGADAERDYWLAMADICSTGVTPALVEAHQALAAALDKERRPASFWGPPRPEHTYALCVQAR